MNTDWQTTVAPAMSRRDRLRRVVILCRDFARNLAYYRTGLKPEHLPMLDAEHRRVNFWRVMNGNCIDICVLEWCKLFAFHNEKHHWSNIVSDPGEFKSRLLEHLTLEDEVFQKEIQIMRKYRDKFLVHLDSELTMELPTLEIARKAVWFYHAHVVAREAQVGDLVNLPVELDAGYAHCKAEANAIYRENA